MDINEILKTEQQRQVNDYWRVVNLYQEGSFYRAYECSAWLYCVCIKEFKVTHRTMKGIDKSVAFIGFPVSSLSKWMPENVIVRQVADKHLTLVLPDSMQTELNSTDEYQRLLLNTVQGTGQCPAEKPRLARSLRKMGRTQTEVNPQSWTQHLLFICEEEH